MKIVLSALLVVSMISCVSTKYNVYKTPHNFANIQAGTKYTFYDFNNRKSFITITSVDKDSIVGVRKKERIAISKRDIKEIKKNKTGATVALVGSGALLLGVTWGLVEATRNVLGTIGITTENP